ncbi:unnamed protein product [Notodromas monacha]|uniref:RGS domain-containing protein n=1 Tax=Notodromas monacha TaxID=399045 RepID=A0A7R9BYL8_9CRUS|nr:unnamed protein product [Notodromas monacha]CAG0924078.1 unnamed protein product [Notodromas monacha]
MPQEKIKANFRDRLREKIRPKSQRSVIPRESETSQARWVNENLSHDRKLSSLLIQAEADVICGHGVHWEWNDVESCLTPSLARILLDQTALTYFIQFLEPLGALCYVQFWLSSHNFRTALRQSENKDRDSSKVDCCPDVHQTLSKLLLEEIGSDPDDPEEKCCGSGDHVGARNKIRVARTVSDCNRACGIVPQWSESAPLTHFQHIVRDAVKICDRHLKSTSLWPKPLPRDLVETILQSVRVNSDGDVFDSDIFLPAQDFVFQILTKDYYTQFLESDAFYNYRIDVLTNKILSLKDYMEKEGHLDLVEFLLTAASITSQLHSDSISPEAAQNDAMVVYDRYISLQATHALGFSDTIRLEVEMSLCRENGLGPDPKTFVRPASVVNTLLTKHFFPEFLKSHLYYTYTQELVTTYQLDHLNARKRMQSSRSEPSKISDETRSVSSSQTTGKALNGMTRSRAESQPKGARKMSTSTSAPVDIRHRASIDPLLLPPAQPEDQSIFLRAHYQIIPMMFKRYRLKSVAVHVGILV